jgi:hypothetical protein
VGGSKMIGGDTVATAQLLGDENKLKVACPES